MIHRTAIISKNAEIDKEVSIGPYCVVEGNVKIEKGTELISHVNISGNTEIGQNNKFFPFSSIGLVPQDKKFKGEDSRLIIGTVSVAGAFPCHCGLSSICSTDFPYIFPIVVLHVSYIFPISVPICFISFS